MARQHVSAALAAARHGYGTARAETGRTLPGADLESTLRMYEYEGARAEVEDALGGNRWEPRL